MMTRPPRPFCLLCLLFLAVPVLAEDAQWTWVGGHTRQDYYSVYGAPGVFAPEVHPSARKAAATWTDTRGRYWLFSGEDISTTQGLTRSDDLWCYDPALGQWAWMKGSKTLWQQADYGIQGVAAPTNTPGVRLSAAAWTGPDGRLWLYGGLGRTNYNNWGACSDLWQFDPATRNWTWIKGSQGINQARYAKGIGVADPANTPGGLAGSSVCMDQAGKVWLFGGNRDGYANGSGSSDLWQFDPATRNWTLLADTSGGTGTGSYINGGYPGWRGGATSWIDAQGRFWVCGGFGLFYDSFRGYFYEAANDLWVYEAGHWKWIKGSNLPNQDGSYGVQGIEASANAPGARTMAHGWTDLQGRLWLFGGYRLNSRQEFNTEQFNDLWCFNPATGNWTWVRGSKTPNALGKYGTLGLADAATGPGGRHAAALWPDGKGGCFLFGGSGLNEVGSYHGAAGFYFDAEQNYGHPLNDLWHLDSTTKNWAWVGGPKNFLHGPEAKAQGSADPANTPGARWQSAAWTGKDGRLWLFGGAGVDINSTVTQRCRDDVWAFDPARRTWSWVKGSWNAGQPAVYGTRGQAAPANTPGSRQGVAYAADAQGRLWLFGGISQWQLQAWPSMNDLWRFDPASGNWTWLSGTQLLNEPNILGTRGQPSASARPGGRMEASAWVDSAGKFWLFSGRRYGYGNPSNDLWCYDPDAGTWTWVDGDWARTRYGDYASGNPYPGARQMAITWSDRTGQCWLFGGSGYGSDRYVGKDGGLNDLWRFDPGTRKWSWMSGSDEPNAQCNPGPRGVASSTYTPTNKAGGHAWIDPSGAFWIFGDMINYPVSFWYLGIEAGQCTNDLWKYEPYVNCWTWVKGRWDRRENGIYGSRGRSAPANMPGARTGAATWTARDGTFWLYGGAGYDDQGCFDVMDDMWHMTATSASESASWSKLE